MTSGKRERRGVESALRQKRSRRGAASITQPTFHQRTTHIVGGFFLGGGDTDSTQSAVMLHPLIIGIVTVNTSLTIIYWTFLLGDAYFKWLMETEDKPKKVVTPA